MSKTKAKRRAADSEVDAGHGGRKAVQEKGKKRKMEEDLAVQDIPMEESMFQRLFTMIMKRLGKGSTAGKEPVNEPPFNVPASKTTEKIYALKNPFVTVTSDPEDVSDYDKVAMASESRMDLGAIRRLVKELVIPVIESKKGRNLGIVTCTLAS